MADRLRQVFPFSILISSNTDQVQSVKSDGRQHIGLYPVTFRTPWPGQWSVKGETVMVVLDCGRFGLAERDDRAQPVSMSQSGRDDDRGAPLDHFGGTEPGLVISEDDRPRVGMIFQGHRSASLTKSPSAHNRSVTALR